MRVCNTIQPAPGSTKFVGIIPKDVWDIEIHLYSKADIDLRLYDAENVTLHAEGQSLVGWCLEPCNIGILSEKNASRCTYNNMTIAYSGFDGDQKVGGSGNEYIRIRDKVTSVLYLELYAYDTSRSTIANARYACARTAN